MAELCAGYGGLGMAIDADLAWYSEIGSAPSLVMAAHHPDTPNLGDLTQIVDPPQVDIVTAGFPCQPVSSAGLQKGITDERWIIDDVCRVARASQARMLVLENVSGLLTANNGHAMAAVCRAMAREGYSRWEWGTYTASQIGAPHRRKRWFCIAYAEGVDSQRAITSGDRRGRPLLSIRNLDHVATDPANGGQEVIGRVHSNIKGRLRDATDADGHRWGQGMDQRPVKHLPAGSFGKYEVACRRWERILGRPAPSPTEDGRLSPLFVEWMQGLPPGWVTGVDLSRPKQLQVLGNGVVPQQAAYAFHNLCGIIP